MFLNGKGMFGGDTGCMKPHMLIEYGTSCGFIDVFSGWICFCSIKFTLYFQKRKKTHAAIATDVWNIASVPQEKCV